MRMHSIHKSYRSVRVTMVRERCTPYPAPRAIRSGRDVAHLVQAVIGDDAREQFLAVYLDSKHKVIAAHTVSIGHVSACPVHPREIFQPAIALSATSLVVAHNHPSGDPFPSNEDNMVTRRLTEVGELLGIQLLDHLVIGDDSYHSSADGQSHTIWKGER